MTELSHRRGDKFEYTFTLASPWTGTTFTGGVKFTIRSSIPKDSSIVTDDDAIHQASVANGEIVFNEDDDEGTITIPYTETTTWPIRRLVWDLQGVISGSPDDPRTIDSGTLQVLGDVTRST